MHKTKYRFTGRSNDGLTYSWESVHPIAPNESRHEVITTAVAPFWSTAIPSTEQAS